MIIGTLSAFIATIGFSVFFHVPKTELIFCGGIGALGWLVYLISVHFNITPVISIFFAALFVSEFSMILAKVRKVPVTIFFISGIIPLVPGAATYQTMYSLLTGNVMEALEHASYTFQSAAVIAAATVITTMIPKIFRSNK